MAQENSKRQRYTLEENFEDVYLRSRTLERYLKNADANIMADKETHKIIQHLTDRQMNVYGKILLWNGFDREDVHSVINIFAACFTGLGQTAKTKRDYYYLMMNFVNQRMEFFIGCVMRKFQVNDVVCQNVLAAGRPSHVWGQEMSDEELLSSEAAKDAHFVDIFDESQMSDTENIAYLEDKLEIMKLQKEKYESTENIEEAIDNTSAIIDAYKHEQNKNARENKTLFLNLKQRLSSNPLRYADQLSYYATYKGIPYEIRKVARSICKKYHIDFINWAKKHVESLGDTDSMHFHIR